MLCNEAFQLGLLGTVPCTAVIFCDLAQETERTAAMPGLPLPLEGDEQAAFRDVVRVVYPFRPAGMHDISIVARRAAD